jgi:hypothetical protein
MSRNVIISIGALLWTLVAVDAIVHVLIGAWITAAAMAIAGVTWVTLRRASWSPLKRGLRARLLPR